MKTNDIKAVKKAVRKVKGLKAANKEFNSITSVLKFMQTAEMMNAGYKDSFEAFGIFKTLTVPMFFASVPVENRNDKGEVGLWGTKSVKDAQGNVIGEEPVLRVVKSWTPTKVFDVLSQAAFALANRKQITAAAEVVEAEVVEAEAEVLALGVAPEMPVANDTKDAKDTKKTKAAKKSTGKKGGKKGKKAA